MNQIGLNECLIARGYSTLRAMLMGIHASGFSGRANAEISVQVEVCVCKEESCERQERGSTQQAAAAAELNFTCSEVGNGARLVFRI